MKMQKPGGYAAIALVGVFILIIVFLTLTQRLYGDITDPVKMMATVSAAPNVFFGLNLLSNIGCILFLILILSLYERMRHHAPNLTRIALIAGTVATVGGIASAVIRTHNILTIAPTQDVSAYRALDAMAAALSSMGAWGWTGLLFGCAILRADAFPRIPGWLWTFAGILWLSNVYAPQFEFPLIRRVPDCLLAVSLFWIAPALLQKEPA